MHEGRGNRRDFLKTTGSGVLFTAMGLGAELPAWAAGGFSEKPIQLPRIEAKTEKQGEPQAPQPKDARVGFAVVGLGHIALEEVLPGLMQSQKAKLVALVSGSPDKAKHVAAQYNVPHVYGYAELERLRDHPEVEAVYIALPNDMHAEYTVRAARAGKHVLCEKPMANSVAECEQMIAACKAAGRQLMIAYRMQYEPHNRAMIQLFRSKALGENRVITADNGQNGANPAHWRFSYKRSGGGAIPDVGIYCLSAFRYLTGEEPVEVFMRGFRPQGDPRFRDIDGHHVFTLRFPSGVLAHGSCAYDHHEQRSLRVMAERGWYGLDPAFAYRGLRMKVGYAREESDYVEERKLDERSQFAIEIDHFCDCVRQNKRPHTPGEEGMQDVRIMKALFESNEAGHPVALPLVQGLDAFRGPAPEQPKPSGTWLPR